MNPIYRGQYPPKNTDVLWIKNNQIYIYQNGGWKATSGEEFLNTFIHETIHLTSIISSAYDADIRGENIAYMIGDACQMLADIICKFSCNHCRHSE